jgi:hypothetical protein
MTEQVDYLVYWHQKVDYSYDYVIVPNDVNNIPADALLTHQFSNLHRLPTADDIARVEQCGGTVTIKVK